MINLQNLTHTTRALGVWRSGAREVPRPSPGQALCAHLGKPCLCRCRLAIASSIPSEAARRLDRAQLVKIKIDDRLQCLASGAVAQRFREEVEPGGILGLQRNQLGDRSTPALRPAARLGRANRADCRCATAGAALAIARLTLGAAEGALALRRAASALRFRHVTIFQGAHSPLRTPACALGDAHIQARRIGSG